ncbi:MAG TPA: CaiB/BaiF CoA-transferase family protein [Stellaceae bacterium]|nr:CaiB/BaiF CoA-transferase family protein [Stellaceae bacterium]
MRPLEGVCVLDFSTLLPGPMATLILAEAGAEVIKIERPESGDEMRGYSPRLGTESVNFALLNRGKRSIAIDLKAADAMRRLEPLLRRADVLVEQFRPGVMDRLGLGAAALRALNPRLVYCAITGYGQTGPRALEAGHDLDYQAATGMLMIAAGADGAPVVPPALIADIGGGAYPAVINILLALQRRAVTGEGCRLDIAMADNLFPFLYWAIGNGLAAGQWPRPGGELVSGGSPRYRIYRTEDDRFVAAAPLEQKFWENFCAAIGLAPDACDDRRDPAATIAAVAAIIARHPATEWRRRFAGKDVCSVVAATIEEALGDPHFAARGLFDWGVSAGAARIAAVPVPVAPEFRAPPGDATAPALGEANAVLAP